MRPNLTASYLGVKRLGGRGCAVNGNGLGFGIDLFELRHEGRLRAGRRHCFLRVVFSIRRGFFGTGLLQPGDFPVSGSQLPA